MAQLTQKELAQVLQNSNVNSYPFLYKKFKEDDIHITNYIAQKENYVYYLPYNNIELSFDGNDYYSLPSITSNINFDITFEYFRNNVSPVSHDILSFESSSSNYYSLFFSTVGSDHFELNATTTAGSLFTITAASTFNSYDKIRLLKEGIYYSLYVNDILISTSSTTSNLFNASISGFLGSGTKVGTKIQSGCKVKNMKGSIFWNIAYNDINQTQTASVTSLVASISNLGLIQGNITQSNTANQSILVSSSTSVTASDISLSSSDKTNNIGYYKNYLKLEIPNLNEIILYEYDNLFGTSLFNVNMFGSSSAGITINEYGYLTTIGLYKRFFGDYIDEITRLKLNGLTINFNLSDYFFESDLRWYKLIFYDTNYFGIFDLYTGIIYLFTTNAFTLNSYELIYGSNQLRKEYIISASINPEEFNYTLNPTAFEIGSNIDYLEKFQQKEEFLDNGDLHLGTTTNWTANYCSISASTEKVFSDEYSLKTTLNNLTTIDSEVYYEMNLTDTILKVNDNIRVEWYLDKGTITANKNFIFQFQQYNGSSYVTTTSLTASITSLPYDEWQRFILYDKIQYVNNVRLKIVINDNPKDSSYFYIDNLSLQLQRNSINESNIYYTGIGLYNNQNDLIAIAKFAQPLRKSTYPLNFKIKFDL